MTAELIQSRSGNVSILTLSNPTLRNALAPEMYQALLSGLNDVADDDTVTSAILTGAKGMFCAGGNLNRLKANRELPRSVQEESIEQLHKMIRAVLDCPKPVIAAVEGAAAGAGYSLALACDMIVAASDAQFVMAYVKVGLSPDGGGSWQLLNLLPRQAAMQQLLTGDAISAPRLFELGVVNQLEAKGQALDGALALCAKFDRLSPMAVFAAKRLSRGARQRDISTHFDLEKASFVECLHGPEAGEAITAFFEKRPARFRTDAKS